MTQPIPYDRLRYYLKPDDFVKLIDPEGNWKFVKAMKDEPMGQVTIQFANAAAGVAAGAASDANRVPFEFTEPARQNRLFQIRLTIFAINRTTGVLIDMDTIAPTIEVEWGMPAGVVRGGTDEEDNVTMNGILNANVGGVSGGRIPANQIYTRDDPSEVFDIWNIFGAFPDFRVVNNNLFPLGGGGAGPLDYDWFLAIQGRKYIIGDVSSDEEEKLVKHELEYRGITVGGIEAVTTRA